MIKTYDEFINNILDTRGRFACGDEYHETHHIIPKCMGGTNDEDNLIDLFAREHFEAHRLLALENPDIHGLTYAWFAMAYQTNKYTKKRCRLTPEEYEECRKAYSEMCSQRYSGEGNPRYGKHCSDETKRKISEALKGDNSGWYGKHHSEESKAKLSDANTGKIRNSQHKQNISNAHADVSGSKNPGAKKIRQYDLNRNLINIWDCMKFVSDTLNISRQKLRACCLGEIESINGFVFEYDDKNIRVRTKHGEKPVVQCSLDLEIIQVYKNARDAERETNVAHTGISACCRGVQKTAGGYRWRFATEEEVAEYAKTVVA